MKRRQFLKSSALGTIAGGALTHQSLLAAEPFNEEILVHIFLRGGIDGANVIVPLGDNDHEYYSILRPQLGIPDSGPGAAVPFGTEPFGFNPSATPLKSYMTQVYLPLCRQLVFQTRLHHVVILMPRNTWSSEHRVRLPPPLAGYTGTFSR